MIPICNMRHSVISTCVYTFDVSVSDIEGVQVGETSQDVFGEYDYLRLLQRAPQPHHVTLQTTACKR